MYEYYGEKLDANHFWELHKHKQIFLYFVMKQIYFIWWTEYVKIDQKDVFYYYRNFIQTLDWFQGPKHWNK